VADQTPQLKSRKTCSAGNASRISIAARQALNASRQCSGMPPRRSAFASGRVPTSDYSGAGCVITRSEADPSWGVLRPIVIRVLHIDDEAPIRLLSRVNLEAEGMEVVEAADGRTGVRLARRELPDVILLNVNLPELDGWQVAEELLEDQETHEIPIVFLTARNALKDRTRGFDLGAVDYVTKPFNPLELAPRVRGLLGRLERGERDELRREKLSELRALIAAEERTPRLPE
jgi:CheY-like chemotaxis protein